MKFLSALIVTLLAIEGIELESAGPGTLTQASELKLECIRCVGGGKGLLYSNYILFHQLLEGLVECARAEVVTSILERYVKLVCFSFHQQVLNRWSCRQYLDGGHPAAILQREETHGDNALEGQGKLKPYQMVLVRREEVYSSFHRLHRV